LTVLEADLMGEQVNSRGMPQQCLNLSQQINGWQRVATLVTRQWPSVNPVAVDIDRW
jgi:hypothetical protein